MDEKQNNFMGMTNNDLMMMWFLSKTDKSSDNYEELFRLDDLCKELFKMTRLSDPVKYPMNFNFEEHISEKYLNLPSTEKRRIDMYAERYCGINNDIDEWTSIYNEKLFVDKESLEKYKQIHEVIDRYKTFPLTVIPNCPSPNGLYKFKIIYCEDGSLSYDVSERIKKVVGNDNLDHVRYALMLITHIINYYRQLFSTYVGKKSFPKDDCYCGFMISANIIVHNGNGYISSTTYGPDDEYDDQCEIEINENIKKFGY